jgi:glycosyltransferase involved in cell wall biosynthesis
MIAPQTSVIVPVRNGERFIRAAIDAALSQLATHDEIIVIDDASTDSTKAILANARDARVRVLDGAGRGVSAARNIGLAAARSEFIAFLDHDDFWPGGRHQTMLKALHNAPEFDAVFGRIRIQLEPDATPWQWLFDMDGRHVPGPSTGLFRRSMLKKIDGFDESLRFGEDLDYFDRLREAGMQFSLCDVDALIYRRHATNCTNDQLEVQSSVFDIIKRKKARSKLSNLRSGFV